jgi:hypothetical protein
LRKLHSKDFPDSVSLRALTWAYYIVHVGENENTPFVGIREDLGVDAGIILRGILKTWCKGVGWVHLAYNRNKWRAFVIMLLNFQIPQTAGNFMSGSRITAA